MNPLKLAAAEQVQGGWIMGVMTVAFLVFFVVWTWWAYSKHNREAFEQAARMPLENGEDDA